MFFKPIKPSFFFLQKEKVLIHVTYYIYMNLMGQTVIWLVTVMWVLFFFSVQKFAGAGTNKLQQSGNRSMSYLAGKAERCVVSLLSVLW